MKAEDKLFANNRFIFRQDLLIISFSWLAVLFFLVAVIFGAYINFSPVPYGDSWMGMVDFYIQSNNTPTAWWAQHNEHRIFFSKLLFWLDMRYFDGTGLLLIPFNVILLGLIWLLLLCYSNKLIADTSRTQTALLAATLGLLCFTWIQNQNIIWSFQSQFILVYFFPLLSFYCLALAEQDVTHAFRWRVLSILLGVFSAHCMANGVLALPILALLSWFTQRSLRWFGFLTLCACVSLAVFLIDYQRSPGTDMNLAILQTLPLRVIVFALAYLGGPFMALFGKAEVAIAAGGVAVLLWIHFFLRRSTFQLSPFALALLAYVAYIFATAGVTAFGRTVFPVEFAATSRYLTPTLTMWGALLILLVAKSRYPAQLSAVGFVLLFALLIPFQLHAFKINSKMPSPQTKATVALGLQLNIHDQRAKTLLFPIYSPEIEGYFNRAREHQVSIFSPNQAYPNQVGKPLASAKGSLCAARVTFSEKVDDQKNAYRIGGTIANAAEGRYDYLLFSNEQKIIKGVAILNRDMPGVAGEPGPLNFDGYMFTSPDFSEALCIKK